MFAAQKLAELNERKRILLAESVIHRRMLALEWDQTTSPMHRWQARVKRCAGMRSWLVWLAPIASFFLLKRSSNTWGFFDKLVTLGRWGQRLFRVWRWWGTVQRKPLSAPRGA